MKICGARTSTPGYSESNPGGFCLVELASDTGLTGIAVAHPQAEKAVLAMARELLEDQDPRGVAAFWQRAEKRIDARSSTTDVHARAVLDIALWDLKAKMNDEPLWKSLGAGRPRVNAYASWGVKSSHGRPFDEWLKQVSGKLGMRAGKLQANKDPDVLRQRFARLREALLVNSHEPQLMLEATECWPPKEAIRRIRALESEFDLTWVSGMAQPGDYRGSLNVSGGISAAVCAGKTLKQRSEFLPYLQNYSADIIELDLHHFGITGALQMADAAFGVELPLTLSAYAGDVQVHLAAALPYCMGVEISGVFPSDSLTGGNVTVNSGWGTAGDEPGNGLTLRGGETGGSTLAESGDSP